MAIPHRGLLDWLDDASAERGLHYANSDDGWDFWSYRRLRELVLRTASAMRANGVEEGDVVALVQRSSPGFVAGLFGALAAGATPCALAPPFAFQRVDEYEKHAAHLLATVRPRMVVCDAESLEGIRKVSAGLETLGEPVLFDELLAGAAPLEKRLPLPDTALIQFTSGSSGFSRGVRISAEALETNLAGMVDWLGCTPQKPAASWLPVHHDMGLVGFLLNVVVTGFDGWMLQPDDFIRSPLRYLRCLSDQQITSTAMPNFGLSYILRRVRPADLEGLRFDALRAVIIGAERIDPQVLHDFHALLGPHGLARGALAPAYGSAEATLAVTGLPLGEGWTTGQPDDGDAASLAGTVVVGCGRPLEGRTVTAVSDDGAALPDGQVGEIVISGVSIADGYLGDAGSASGTSLDGRRLHTGDAGFLRDGQLFVIGRLGDGIKVSGKMVFAESLETLLHQQGVPQRQVAVLLGVHEGTPTAAVVFAGIRPGWRRTAHEVLSAWVGDAALVSIEVPRGGIAVTSSGKPRRRVLWQGMCAGRYAEVSRPLTTED